MGKQTYRKGGHFVRAQFSLGDTLYRRAKRVAKRRGISFAELCRRSVVEAIAKEPLNLPWMQYAGIIDGAPDESVCVDQIVYGRRSP